MATSNITNLTNIKELGDGSAGGTRLGKTAAELVGFHGATPSVQGTVITNTSGSLGNVIVAVSAIISVLQTKGIRQTPPRNAASSPCGRRWRRA